jgi:general L-amino acid transport system substrate-binding protein
MLRPIVHALRCASIACFLPLCVALPSGAADDVFTRVRAHNAVHCASIIRPGYAVPALDGSHWYGLAADLCRAVAAAVLGSPDRIVVRPYLQSGAQDPLARTADDIVFLSGAQLVGGGASGSAALELGPVIAHDGIALLVPSGGPAHVADLAGKPICVEAGSPAERALFAYFPQHALSLREHPFQETDEMRQAYAGGGCAALAGPLSTLASVRADPQDGRASDQILPELVADDPVVAATPADARWSRIVWWTFSALVDAEESRASGQAKALGLAVSGVPPAVGGELGLPASWARDALAAGGDYGTLFERNLGAQSRFGLARGANALWDEGGLIFGLSVR